MNKVGLFEHTVSAICYQIAYSEGWPQLASYNDVTRFVLQQWGRMPRFFAWPLRLATVWFAVSGLSKGHLFHRLSPQRRAIQLESWRSSRLGPYRDLVRFYRSLALLSLYSRPEDQPGTCHAGA
jgi:hypothetical protein